MPRLLWLLLTPALLLTLWASALPAEQPNAAGQTAQAKIAVLIVDGQINWPHDWVKMTAWYKSQLEKSGRFAVDVSSTPNRKAPPAAWDNWRPQFKKYQVVLSVYNGQMWPDPVKKDFEQYVRDGGGFVIVHCANNAFPGWVEFDKMVGLGWRDDPGYGNRVTLDDSGKPTIFGPRQGPRGVGKGASHGLVHNYRVVIRDPQHPITKGLPPVFMHVPDELYDSQRGPAENLHILASAFSDRKMRGTGANEPIVWWVPYGQGKVVTDLMGHVDIPSKGTVNAARCAAHTLIVERACEWAATGQVTIPVPARFPTADKAVEAAD